MSDSSLVPAQNASHGRPSLEHRGSSVVVYERNLRGEYAELVVMRQAQTFDALPIVARKASPQLVRSGLAAVPTAFIARIGRLERRTRTRLGAPSGPTVGSFEARSLARRLLQREPDVVYCRFLWNGLELIAPIERVRRKIPLRLVTHSGGSDVTRLRTAPRSHLDSVARLLDASDHTLCGSRFLAGRLSEHFPFHDIECHYSGVHPRMLLDEPPHRADSERVQFLAVSRLHEVKGLDRTIEAFSQLSGEVDAELTIIGDGPMKAQLRGQVVASGLSDRVHLTGALSHEDVLVAIDRSHVLVQHGIPLADGSEEGMPGSVLEAASRALPVVASRVGGVPEIVVDGSTGFLVEPGDIGGMAERMHQLAGDREMRERMGAAGRRLILENHDPWKQDAKLLRLLTEGTR